MCLEGKIIYKNILTKYKVQCIMMLQNTISIARLMVDILVVRKTHLGFWCDIILNGFFIVQKQHIKLLGVVEPIQKVYSVYFCLSQKIYRQAGLYDRNTNYIGWQR